MSEHDKAAFRLECLKLALGFGPRVDAVDLAGWAATPRLCCIRLWTTTTSLTPPWMTDLVSDANNPVLEVLRHIRELAHNLDNWETLGDARTTLSLIDILAMNALPELWDKW